MAKVERLHGLDFLRGVAALGVLAYHYLYYGDVANISMFGTYGVYLFFCLSGFSLELVYGQRSITSASLSEFFYARFFRIFPMYAAMVIFALLTASAIDRLFLTRTLLNLTFLFGVNNPGYWSITPGGWSIGVEWFFYMLFPLFWAIRGLGFSVAALIITTILNIQLTYLAYFTKSLPAESIWINAIQPVAFINYFLAGVFGCRLYRRAEWTIKNDAFITLLLAIFVVSLSVPIYLGISRTHLLTTSVWPLFYFALCAGLAYASAGYRSGSKALTKLSTFLGEISYSVYLIHLPLFFQLRGLIGDRVDNIVLILLCAILSISLAKLLHDRIEMPLRRHGKALVREKNHHACALADK
ncbi:MULTISPECIES: acyltransferase [unclassified Aminobacter]|uniref:acyltransferase family protein n=1 Tax=unclassified Aminobacter TaxID=2644704 RepID=UPI0004657C62|nr:MULTISPECIES: acyltransferase [unclassified Aminobacter]TWH23025.1 peptidoglycan/LPS O-acetylase OafA/YrhL [Aminobacter sp. J15]